METARQNGSEGHKWEACVAAALTMAGHRLTVSGPAHPKLLPALTFSGDVKAGRHGWTVSRKQFCLVALTKYFNGSVLPPECWHQGLIGH